MFLDYIGIIFILGSIVRVSKKQSLSHCMVVSHPEGAEIFMNNKKIEALTPTLIQMPIGPEVTFVIKKYGYQDKTVFVKSKNKLSFFYCELERVKLRLVDSGQKEIERREIRQKEINVGPEAR